MGGGGGIKVAGTLGSTTAAANTLHQVDISRGELIMLLEPVVGRIRGRHQIQPDSPGFSPLTGSGWPPSPS